MVKKPSIVIGGIYHETNSFARGATGLEDFHAYQYFTGHGIHEMASTRSEMGGFLDELRRREVNIIPATYAAAVPSAVVGHGAFLQLRDEILEAIDSCRHIDGVLLSLHGAMVTDESEDPDGDLIAAVLDLVGGDVPVAVTLDLHANVTLGTEDGLEALVAYDTYPHIDMFERGQEAASILAETLQKEQRRHVAHRKLPFMTAPGMQSTDGDPMVDLLRTAHQFEADTGVQVSLTPGFSYADVDGTGFSVLVSDWDQDLAEEIADNMANVVLGARERFTYEALSVSDACDVASRDADRPVILVDAADNIGGGAPGDGTAILEQWLKSGYKGLVVTIADAESARHAILAGEGETVELTLGAKTDSSHGEPLRVIAQVIRVTDGQYTHKGSYNTGYQVSMGPTAVLDILGNTVIVSSLKAMPFDAEQLVSQGLRLEEADAIVVKSAIAWRAAYGDLAGTVLEVDTPGICTSRLDRLNWSAKRRAMLPNWKVSDATELNKESL